MAQKNVLVTTMSTLSRELKANWYYYFDGKDKWYCDGISALEAGTKYFLFKYRIDEIVVIGSRETGCKKESGMLLDTEKKKEFEELYDKTKSEKKYTPCEFYRYRIAAFLWKERSGSKENFSDVTEKIVKGSENFSAYENEKKLTPKENMTNDIKICFVPEQLEGNPNIDNISGIVETVRGDYKGQINLYIDMQGGNRTSGFVRNAVLSILNNQNSNQITIKEIAATKFEPGNKEHEIVEETYRYRILDLVSGMNAFIQYGKADMLQKYCKDMGIEKDSSVDKLVKHMSEIDEAISLCDVNSLVEAIKELKYFFKNKVVEENTYVGNIFHILQTEIKKDYGKLLSKEVDYLELISWCVRKGFVQQALTLIEDKMPEVYIGEGKVISYRIVNGEKKSFMWNLGPRYEKRWANKIFYHLEGMCSENQTIDLLQYLHHGKAFREDSEKKEFGDSSQYKQNEIVKKKLKEKGIEENETTDLSKIKEKMNTETEEDFAEQYRKFRRWEDAFESNGGIPDLTVAANLYDYLHDYKEKNYWGNFKPYFSIVRCCGEKQYTVKAKDNRKIEISLNIQMHPKLASDVYKRKTDDLFLLHEALKKERNCSNHASDKGVRLSIKTVKRAIEIYVKWAREILSRIS